MCLAVSQAVGHNSKPAGGGGAPCTFVLCFWGEVQSPMTAQRRIMEPRLWGSGKQPRGRNAILTLTKGKNQVFKCKHLGI